MYLLSQYESKQVDQRVTTLDKAVDEMKMKVHQTGDILKTF